MRWFEGSIAEAVASSKAKEAVFVVFVEGSDETSSRTAAAIENPDVLAKLESNDFVAIKLDSGTEEYKQFTQIYRIVPVPSLFFIGSNGRPIEIVAGSATPESILSRIDTVLATAKGKASAPVSTSSAGATSSSVAASSSSVTATSSAVETGETPENVAEKAKELVEKARLLKLAQDKAKEKEQEEERRRVGKEVQQLRRWQQDQEMKQLMEERNKDKREEQAARERVREQIAMDKAERAKKNAQEVTTKKEEPSSVPSVPIATSNSGVARLQLRLPDGTSITTQQASSAPLSDVRRLVSERLGQPARSFSMATAYPRRELTADLDAQSMLELGLTPTAVILVLQTSGGSSVVPSSSSAVSTITWAFWSMMAPVLSVLNYVRSLVFGGGASTGASANQQAAARRRADPTPEPQQGRQPRNAPPSTTVRRQGNVHRLAQPQDSSDEENNTWNGNSTQQM